VHIELIYIKICKRTLDFVASRRHLWRACVVAMMSLMLTDHLALAAELDPSSSDYVPGRGFQVPNTDLTVGGYITGEYSEHGSPVLSISNASLLFWWENDSPLKFFSEIDLQRGLTTEGSLEAQQSQYLSLERLYADYAVTDELTLRAGKYLTPIGRWNQVHADPLVWTTSRPLVTEIAFPTSATGVMALGTVSLYGKDVDYAFYAAEGGDIRATPNVDPFQKALGVRANVTVSDSLQLGASLASFAQRSDRKELKNLAGADFLWQRSGYEFTGEAIYRLSESTSVGNERGFFLQGVAPLTERLFAVYRYELFSSGGILPGPGTPFISIAMGMRPESPGGPPPPPLPPAPPTVRLNIIGLTFRYHPNLVMKVEFVNGSDGPIRAPIGVLSSISLLF
jgi:hypothetical protein